jgi:glycosyltransferase involved in cell wall biosynthesis
VRYIPEDCDANARSLFGIEPVWVPQSDRIRSILEDRLPRGSLAPFNNPGIIRSDEWYTEHLPDPRGPIRLGRYSRDNLIKFPNDPEKLLAAYPADEQFSVSMMGARDSLEVILGTSDVPKHWTIFETNAVSVKDFLQSIDFFVYFNNSMTHEAFGRSLLEAIASGVVVIADRYHESTFAHAAVYCDPSEVREVVRSLAADPDSYRSQVRAAQEIVRERFSPQAFRRIVAADGLIKAP